MGKGDHSKIYFTISTLLWSSPSPNNWVLFFFRLGLTRILSKLGHGIGHLDSGLTKKISLAVLILKDGMEYYRIIGSVCPLK